MGNWNKGELIMAENDTNDLTGSAFLDAVKEAGLTDALSRYMQSETDKKVAAISEKKESKLLEQIEKLTSLLGSNTREKIVNDALKAANLDAKFTRYITGNNAEEIKASVAGLQLDFLGIKQKEIDDKLKAGELGPVKNSSGDLTSNERIKSYVENQNLQLEAKPALGYTQKVEKVGEK